MADPLLSGLAAPTGVGRVALSAGGSLVNGKIDASVADDALTVSVKTLVGDDPSENFPVYVSFRDRDDLSVTVTRAITSTLQVVVEDGDAVTSQISDWPFRLWVSVVDYNGAVKLTVASLTRWTSVAGEKYSVGTLPEAALYGSVGKFSTTTSSQLYAEDAIPVDISEGGDGFGFALRIAGYLEWSDGLPVMGEWSLAPDIIRQQTTGSPCPGDIIEERLYVSDDHVTHTTDFGTFNDTAPTTVSGTDVLETGHSSLLSAANVLEVVAVLHCACSIVSPIGFLLSSANTGTIGVSWGYSPAADVPIVLTASGRTQTSFGEGFNNIVGYAGPTTTPATFAVNGISSGRIYGGTLKSQVRMKEIMG